MRRMSDRKIKVKKATLIAKIKENKTAHIKEFAEAVTAYKEEADKQLKANLKRIAKKSNKHDLKFQSTLIVPMDRTDNYEKLITQFSWEEEAIVELSQREFNEYIHDETDWAVSAKFANSTYIK